MLHLLKTGSILFPWFAHFKKTTFCKTLCIQKGLFCQGLFCELRKASVQVRQSENWPLSEAYKRNKKYLLLMLSVKHRFSGEEAGTLPSKKHKRLAPSQATATPNKPAPGTGSTRWWRLGRRVTQSRSQKRSGSEWRNRKWHRIFFLSICIFFSGCNRSFAAFSAEWQASEGKLTLLKYEFHRLCFLQNTKSDQSLLIGKRGLSCSRPAARIGGVYWRVKFNL